MPSSSGGLAIQQFNYLAAGNTRQTPVNPGATGADNVLAVFTIPAGFFDGVSGRGFRFMAMGSFATNGNNKTVKIIFNPATAVVGSTVGTGGTTLVSTGVTAASNQEWFVDAAVIDPPGSVNSQIGFSMLSWFGLIGVTTFAPSIVPTTISAIESADILVAITGNAATTATDISLLYAAITGFPS